MEHLDAAATTESKRERQRQHAKRSYYKRVKAMAALKLQREELEKQYHEALAAAPLGSPVDCSTAHTAPMHDASGSELVDRIMALTSARDELRLENQALKSAIVQYFTLQRRLQQSLEDMDSESDAQTRALLTDTAVAEVCAHQFERAMLTKPLTTDECRALNRQSHDEMVSYLDSSGGPGAAGPHLCGWQEFRGSHNGRFRFSTRKHFAHHSALTLATKTWALLSDPAQFQDMYSSNITMELDLVQRVDDDHVVFYRTMQIPNSTRVSKTLLLVSRFVDPRSGHVVLLRSLDRSLLQSVVSSASSDLLALVTAATDGSSSVWMEVFTWAVFSEAGAQRESCGLEFGGFVTHATPEASEFWMLEALLISLRWESRVVGPVFNVL